MLEGCCPSPTKKLRILSSSDSSESEELNLSPTFDETYKKLMNDEIVSICMKKHNSIENLNVLNNISEFTRKCDEFHQWIKTVYSQNVKQQLCRSNFYLEKMYHSRQLLQSSRFVDIKMLGKVLITHEPQLRDVICNGIMDIERQWHPDGFFNDTTVCHVLDDIDEDIGDIVSWLSGIRQKLNFDIVLINRKRDDELIQYILRDFEVHNKIGLSVIKAINELQEQRALPLFSDRINASKAKMHSAECDMYQQWLKAIEYKLRLKDDREESKEGMCSGGSGMLAHESGFESELSPMYRARKLCRTGDTPAMKYISSGDNMSDGTTYMPSDTESAALSINRVRLSVSPLYSSTETMPELSHYIEMVSVKNNAYSAKKVIRRKKRRSKRQLTVHGYNLSTEDSETCPDGNARCSLKRRINETNNTHVPALPVHSTHGLNYLEIADEAERLLRNQSTRVDDSTIESPKESETEDVINPPKNSFNDIDLEKNWDYYQAPMYSNEEGDSEIVEIDKIKDWEAETDTDGIEILVPLEDSPFLSEKRLSMMTSGYETSIDSDPTVCSKSLICVLQFTIGHQKHVEKRMTTVLDEIDTVTPVSLDSMLSTMTDCDSVAQTHLKLIGQILDTEACFLTHSTSLKDNLRIMEHRWRRIRDRCIATQMRLVEDRMTSFDNYCDAEELARSIDAVQELGTIIHGVRTNIDGDDELKETFRPRMDLLQERLSKRKELMILELDVVSRSVACVAQSKCSRKLFVCELRLSRGEGDKIGSVDVQDVYEKFEKSIHSLRKCSESLNSISSSACRTKVASLISRETQSWKTLCSRVRNDTPITKIVEEIESLQPQYRRRLLRHLPMHIAIVIVAAMIGWWYNQSSSNDCRSSSFDWLWLLYKYSDRLEPH